VYNLYEQNFLLGFKQGSKESTMTGVMGEALPLPQTGSSDAAAAETSSGRVEGTRWVVVAANLNPGEALIIKARLESERIPALVQQEAVGAVLGLTVGPLGSARVLVPEPLAEQAEAILAVTFEVGEEEEKDDPYENRV
jgi:hypothetical protein